MKSNKLFLIALIAISGLAMAFTITNYQKSKNNMLLIFPKGSNYVKEWKKVDSLTAKGLNKSALEVVNGIYDKAKIENNAPQFVKAIIHRMKFEQYMEEYSLVKALNKLNEEAKEATFPVKPILQSMIAESYWQYYQNNRWKFYNRTTTVNFNNDDITTWDLKTVFSQVVKNYQASLESADSLKRTPLNIYDEVLIKQPNSRKFRPTLYDFIAHRAVDFYMNEEPDIIRPAYKFELNDVNYFNDFETFSKLKIETKDTLSSKYYALKILQELIIFHSETGSAQLGGNEERATSLIDVDLKRLKFVKNKSVSEIKDSLYLRALQNLEKRFTSNSASAEVNYEIGKEYLGKGNKYKPLQSEENKWFKKQALELCEAVIKKYPKSDGAINCEVLKAQINEHAIDFITDKVALPNQRFRALLTYKNLKTVYVRIAQMDIDKYNKSIERYYGEQLIKQYLKLTPIKEWTIELPIDEDYQSHSTEIKIPELPLGHYVILMGSEKTFSYKNNGVAYAPVWSSNISYINRKMTNGSYDFYLQHRETGAPLKGVSAQLYYEKYNYPLRKYEYVKSEKFTSDEAGYFNVPSVGDYRNFSVDFSYNTPSTAIVDHLQTDNAIYQYKTYIDEKRREPKTFFFMDRAIYRPGQTVYFKGIMINTDGETNEIMPNAVTTITFYDVNSQKVADVDLTTNEYGSFNGSFTTPSGVLNGQMSLNNGSGSIYFSVEEYKRPKFEVTFNPVKGSYRLDEIIKVEGSAKAYSGAKIDGAEVKYRVVRNASFPYWWYWWRGYYPQSAQMEITNGLATSNDTGAFFIDFKAIPDLSIPKSYQPTYSYTVYADVTDINGETHSSQTYVSVAYTALNLNVNIPTLLENENKEAFAIYTTNMSGQFASAQGKVEIFKLKEPEKTFRSRAWSQPDKFLLSKEEFEKAFPKDEYKDENNMYKWGRGEKVFEKTFRNTSELISPIGKVTAPNTNDSVKIPDLKSWKKGLYVMEAHSKDAYGEDVKDVKYFTVYSNSGSEVPSNEINWFNLITINAIEPGGKAKFVIGSKEDNVKVLYEIEHKGAIIKKEYITLNKEQKLIEIPVEEKYRGNFSFHCIFIKNNRSYMNDGAITVPYTNKELDIEFETFRNKLLPGQQEEWKVKIKDKKGDKLAAEMMATLYDASLDAFKPNNWYFDIYNNYYSSLYWDVNSGFGTANAQVFNIDWNKYPNGAYRYYDHLNWFGYNNAYYGYGGDMDGEGGGARRSRMAAKSINAPAAGMLALEEQSVSQDESVAAGKSKDKEESKKSDSSGNKNLNDVVTATTAEAPSLDRTEKKADGEDMSKVAARSNFAETAFFFPQLETDKDGNIIIKFTIPEALTKWKMMGFAHTKDLKFGSIQKELVTQKELMVIPNAPRFFRENDKMEFSTKISNLSDKDLTGTAQLFLFDAITMTPLNIFIVSATSDVKGETTSVSSFNVRKGQSTSVSWNIAIPEGVGAISYKVVAKAGNFSDGEEMAVPVLTNRMLVTETMPLPVRGNQTKTFRFEKLINQSNASTTLRNHKLTLEFTANPAWYAVQALPYLMEYPYECSEQTFSRFYANSIASHIANSSPKIKAVFDSWKNTPDSKALLSNLEKNQELKSLMVEETPWVLDAKDETERKKRVAVLFDLNKMSSELAIAMKKLQKQQSSNGGWPWFEGMPDDRYITQHIITGMGHLDHLGVKSIFEDKDVFKMVEAGVKYLDNRIREDYEWILKHDKAHIDENHLSYQQIQYLYARSYYNDKVAMSSSNKEAFGYYKGQAKKYWLQNNRYMQGMIALALHRYDDKVTPKDIMKSLKENSLNSEEMGMYWKENYEGYYWYQAPIESQALLIEAFDEVSNDKKAVDDLKVWLLKSKQTQDWKTTKATTEAVYALLLRGTDWLATESNVEISLGELKIDPKKMPDLKQEAGTGYFKTSWSGSDIKPTMGEVTVVKKDEGVSWGAMYWQYFEQLDKITPSKTPLNLKKQLFLQKNTDAGPVIEPVSEKTTLKVGDKIKVRIELRVDRDMEYVQMKDMRASGFEPTNVISRYKWQDGLGYYESTRDAATNFFFDRLPKGTYVFEYPLVVTHNGNFSNGITSIQCMYAPEFTSNSEGIRVKVGK